MVTVLRESGLRFAIYLDDHPPPHVHVVGDGSAKIALANDEGQPAVVRAARMKASEVRKALRIVIAHREALIEKWKELHG